MAYLQETVEVLKYIVQCGESGFTIDWGGEAVTRYAEKILENKDYLQGNTTKVIQSRRLPIY